MNTTDMERMVIGCLDITLDCLDVMMGVWIVCMIYLCIYTLYSLFVDLLRPPTVDEDTQTTAPYACICLCNPTACNPTAAIEDVSESSENETIDPTLSQEEMSTSSESIYIPSIDATKMATRMDGGARRRHVDKSAAGDDDNVTKAK